MNRRSRPRQGGFTLIELVIAIAIMGVLLPALAGAFFVTFKTVDGTSDRVGSSAGTVLAATDFGPDVQSSTSITGAAGSHACVVSVSGAQILFTAVRADTRSTWYRTASTVGRVACDFTGAVTASSSVVVDPTTTPVVLCGGTACAPGTSTPSSVALTFRPIDGTDVRLAATRRNP